MMTYPPKKPHNLKKTQQKSPQKPTKKPTQQPNNVVTSNRDMYHIHSKLTLEQTKKVGCLCF